MNREAARFYHATLYSPAGAPGLEYLTKRGLSGATIKHFGLGFAPGRVSLADCPYLMTRGYTAGGNVRRFLCG